MNDRASFWAVPPAPDTRTAKYVSIGWFGSGAIVIVGGVIGLLVVVECCVEAGAVPTVPRGLTLGVVSDINVCGWD